MSPTPDAPQTTYDPRYFSPLFEAEARHFWFRSRNTILSRMIQKLTAGLSDGYRLLEVGCGTGNVLHMLEETCARGKVAGMDLFADGLRFARRRVHVPLIQGDMVHPPFQASFDLVCMFDVLEHLPDDAMILGAVQNMLKPGGRLVLTVPADPRLWSYFDTASHHFRRYTAIDLKEKLLAAGFEVETVSPYMAAIYPMVWLNRRLAGAQKQELDEAAIEKLSTDELKIVPIVNEVLAWVLSLEAGWLAAYRRLPTGTSIIAVARKSD